MSSSELSSEERAFSSVHVKRFAADRLQFRQQERDGKNGSHSSSMQNEWVKLIRHDGMHGLNSPDVTE